MNTFSIPPSPNWFLTKILACAPDNTLIYGSKNDIIIIHPSAENESPKIEILPDEGCYQRVVCVDINPKWNSPNKWILSSSEDNVRIWDVIKVTWKKCSPPSKGDKDNLVGAQFLSEDRILNVFESGAIVICHIPLMKFTQLSNIITGKVLVTCFAPCPHSPHIAAFGMKNGLIIVANLKKSGTLLHKLRGHTGEVVNLTWCPAPVNIFPQKPGNHLKINNIEDNRSTSSIGLDIYEENKEGKVTDETIICVTNEELDNANSLNIKKPDDEKKELTEEITPANNEERAIEEINISDNNQVDHNLLIEKIENLIIEAEEKSVEHKTDDIPEPSELLFKDKQLNIEETKVLMPTETQYLTLERIDIEEEISLNSEEKPSSSDRLSEEIEPRNTIITPVAEEPRKEFLLASSGRDSSVNIWRAGSDGRLQCFFKLLEKKNYNKNKKSNKTSWIAIKWVTPFSLLVGTTKGELLKYILPKPLDGKKECTLIHNEHSNFIFAIAAHIPILTEENWFIENEVKIWTFSFDLFLLNTILDSKITHLSSVETFSALVNCMAHSPVDPNRIALGLSNGTIKIWNANNSSGKSFSTANYSPKIYGKITCLEWHPKNEVLIAFSTEEGTIGLLNTNNKHKATWFQQYFASTVHKIQWAPYKGKTCLYAIGKGKLVCFNPDETKEEPIKINLSSDVSSHSFAWKLDMSWMLVSTNCGKIMCYNSDLTFMAIYHHTKKINSMVWHPDSEISTTTRSFWVASALDNVVYIFDLAEILEKKGTLNFQDLVRKKIEVHYGTIKSLAWNPFDGDQLVTAGEDGLAHVLNVSNGTVLATYRDNTFQPIKAIMWSPIQEELLIMTMSRWANLRAWKLSDHKGPLSNDVLKTCEHHYKNSKKMNSTTQKEEGGGKKVKNLNKSAKSVILQASLDDVMKTLKSFMKEQDNSNSMEDSSNIQQLFGTKNDVLSMLSCNEKSHLDKQKFEAAATVSVFKGDLQNHINEAIEQYRVTPLLISLAPSVSISLWQKTCETYAEQLQEKSDANPLEVVPYFLAGQNIEKAIEYLCVKEMYKEALALAKARLPHDSVILDDLVLRWAKFAANCGNMETAALCYMKLGKHEEAVNLLFRRNDLEILSLALALAKKIGNEEMIKAVEFRYNAFSKDDGEIEKSDGIPEKDVIEAEANASSSTIEIDDVNEHEQVLVQSTNEVGKKDKAIEVGKRIQIEDQEVLQTDKKIDKEDKILQTDTNIEIVDEAIFLEQKKNEVGDEVLKTEIDSENEVLKTETKVEIEVGDEIQTEKITDKDEVIQAEKITEKQEIIQTENETETMKRK